MNKLIATLAISISMASSAFAEDRAPTTELERCLSINALSTFVSVTEVDFSTHGKNLIVIHATEGDVFWVYEENKNAYCHLMYGGTET